MKGRLFMLLAMMGMIGGSYPGYSGTSPSNRNSAPKRTNEQNREKFFADLQKENERKAKEFPSWKVRQINGVSIVASNPKTAVKTLNFLLKSNGLQSVPEQKAELA